MEVRPQLFQKGSGVWSSSDQDGQLLGSMISFIQLAHHSASNTRQVMHARSGGQYEIMGLMQVR